MTQETITLTAEERDALIVSWRSKQDILQVAKEEELAARAAVKDALFPNPERGTNTIELGQGYKLKLVHKQNFNLDKDSDKVEAMLDKLEKTGSEGAFLAERLVKWKSELSVSEYNKLDAKYKKIVDNVLTITDATPSLELVEPKAKK